jgi:hypothetical protein
LNCDKADQHKSSKLENSRCETNIKTERAKKKIDGFIPKRIDKEDEAYHEVLDNRIHMYSKTLITHLEPYKIDMPEITAIKN